MSPSLPADDQSSSATAQIGKLFPGTTFVGSFRNSCGGDFESLAIVVKDAHGIRSHISNEFCNGRNLNYFRFVSNEDVRSARIVNDVNFPGVDDQREQTPGTSGFSLSMNAFHELKANKAFDASSRSLMGGKSFLPGRLEVVEDHDVPVRVLFNDREMDLPTVHARGVFGAQSGDYWFLDSPDVPLIAKESLIENNQGLESQIAKIIVPVDQKERIASALSEQGQITLEGIYFDFAKATIRPESYGVLTSVAEVLRDNLAWRVRIEGHTDKIGTDAFNIRLSANRASAVRQALVVRFRVSASRLSVSGYGARRPKTSNDTPEGRAFNRRVELVRTDHGK